MRAIAYNGQLPDKPEIIGEITIEKHSGKDVKILALFLEKSSKPLDFCPITEYIAFCPFTDIYFVKGDFMEKKHREYWEVSNQCEKEIVSICREYELKHNISDTAFWILYVLHGSEEQITQTDICNSLYQPRQSTNSALKKLEEDGIIEKIPVPGNQKSKFIVLTKKGKTFAERIVVPMKQAEQDTLALFSDEEIEIHLSILRRRCEIFRTLIGNKAE